MNLTVAPKKLCGSVTAAKSKSITHRALICAWLCGGSVKGPLECDDTLATRRCLAALENGEEPYAGDSATTLRLLLPLALLKGGATFRLGGGLARRPLADIKELGLPIERQGERLAVKGTLTPGRFTLSGGESSQLLSGLLLALPLLNKDSEIEISGELCSRPYVELTLDMMRRFGVSVRKTEEGFFVPGGQRYSPVEVEVEGDWSYAANFIAANALGGNVEILGLDPKSIQGDRAVRELLAKRQVDMRDCPDLLPALAVAACGRQGDTLLYNAARLRTKESDRLHSMAAQLNALGGNVTERADGLLIHGTGRLVGGIVDACRDHRVAMALVIAAAICDKPVEIGGAECVAKSAPGFFEDIKRLGGML